MSKYAGTKTEKNLMEAFAGESQARNKYTFYASVAKKAGYEQMAALYLETAEQEKEHAIASPLKGEVVPMEETQDETFIVGVLGKGVCIRPEGDTVTAPEDGTVIALMGHAVGLKLDSGAELIIHVGVNTVELNGKHFEAFVASGDRVVKGQRLMKFDANAEAGYLTVTPVLVTNPFEYQDVETRGLGKVDSGEKLLTVIR